MNVTFRSPAVRAAAFALAAAGAVAGVAALPAEAGPDRPDAAATKSVGKSAAETALPKKGVDVSHYDSGFRWKRDDIGFGIVKATEGTSRVDDTFARHWKAVAKQGLVRGAYHYGHPKNDPVEEADHFLGTVGKGGLRDGDLLVLDLETTDGRSGARVNAWAKTWLKHVEAETGVKPMFYSSFSFAQEHGDGLGDYPLWVAHYGRKPGKVAAPAPWKTWAIHQYTDEGHDWNVSREAPGRLRALGYSAAKDPAR